MTANEPTNPEPALTAAAAAGEIIASDAATKADDSSTTGRTNFIDPGKGFFKSSTSFAGRVVAANRAATYGSTDRIGALENDIAATRQDLLRTEARNTAQMKELQDRIDEQRAVILDLVEALGAAVESIDLIARTVSDLAEGGTRTPMEILDDNEFSSEIESRD